MLPVETDFRAFLNARLREALLKVCPVAIVLCLTFVAFSLFTRPPETRWATASISMVSASMLAAVYWMLLRRPGPWVVEAGSLATAMWLLIDATASTIISGKASDLVYIGVILLASGSIFVHRKQMAILTSLATGGGALAWMMSPQNALWFEMALASAVAGLMGIVAFYARSEAFSVAFNQGRQRLEEGLRHQRAAAGADSALWEYEPGADVLKLAPRWATLLGLDPRSLSPRLEKWTSRVHEEDRPAVVAALRNQLGPDPPRLAIEHRLRCADGSLRWMLASGTTSLDASGRPRIAGSFTDIQQRKELEQELRYEALHDRLTDLANRRLLLDRLDQVTALVQRHPERRFAVVFFDLDGFKRINDLWGHAAGDLVLIEIADRLKKSHRCEDVVARFGGDEFVVVLHEVASRADAEQVADRSRVALEQPVELDGRTAWVSVSYGVAWSEDGHKTGKALLEAADTAMYNAKHSKGDDRRRLSR